MQESRLIEIIFLICTLATPDQCPTPSHLESPEGAPLRVAAEATGLEPQHPLFTGVTSNTVHTQN